MNVRITGYLIWAVILLWSNSVVSQQNPHGQISLTSLPEPYPFLVRDVLVHDELGLTTRQRQAVKALNDELDGALWSMRNKSPQHITQTLRATTEKSRERLASILTRQQQQRLTQIELWTLGMKSLLRDDVAEKLNLSEKQAEQIRETLRETQDAINELSKRLQAGESRESLEQEARTLRTAEQKEIVATLTSRQRREWLAILGEQIDASQLGRVKFRAPELDGRDGWINSPPLTIQQLKGKVVALHFYAFG
jgi:hypothetical protein